MARTGVFICHCGSNIASVVDVEQVAEAIGQSPGVLYAATQKYACSQPGQDAIRQAITQHGLDRIVVAACSPRVHEETFRGVLSSAGLNPYMLEIANIREQCAWVHTDKEKATAKAIGLARMSAAKAAQNQPLSSTSIPVNKRCLVIGGGIAGIQAALDVANAGYPVTLVERQPSIGGKMIMLDKTFPTLDCSACICTPKMTDVGSHPNITLMTSSEVVSVSGYIGSFEATVRTKPRYVDHDACTGCGLCETKCPAKIDSEFDQGLAKRKAIYKLFPQAVPSKPVIDPAGCLRLTGGKCGICEKVCPCGAVRFDDAGSFSTDKYGAIIVATGYDLIDWKEIYPEYGGGICGDIINGLQFERLANASGPTEGRIQRPSDGQEPKSVVIVKCVGSRDFARAKGYCSRACCMYAAKHAKQVLEKIPGAACHIFYIDVRTPGKGYEEFYDDTRADGVVYVRGRVSKIYKEAGKLVCLGEDTLIGKPVSVEADLVVLETAMTAAQGIEDITGILNISRNQDNWLNEAHPKLRPAETHTAGVFLCGTCQGPKDIPDTVAQSSAAAMKVCALFSKDELYSSPMIADVDSEKCTGCGICAGVCPYKALEILPEQGSFAGKRVTKLVCKVNPGLCQGCGACCASCRDGAIDLLGFTNKQILEEVDALCLS